MPPMEKAWESQPGGLLEFKPLLEPCSHFLCGSIPRSPGCQDKYHEFGFTEEIIFNINSFWLFTFAHLDDVEVGM